MQCSSERVHAPHVFNIEIHTTASLSLTSVLIYSPVVKSPRVHVHWSGSLLCVAEYLRQYTPWNVKEVQHMHVHKPAVAVSQSHSGDRIVQHCQLGLLWTGRTAMLPQVAQHVTSQGLLHAPSRLQADCWEDCGHRMSVNQNEVANSWICCQRWRWCQVVCQAVPTCTIKTCFGAV